MARPRKYASEAESQAAHRFQKKLWARAKNGAAYDKNGNFVDRRRNPAKELVALWSDTFRQCRAAGLDVEQSMAISIEMAKFDRKQFDSDNKWKNDRQYSLNPILA
jgi:hypothetical protein